jgi:drug/metabolite transporter (DMT)-like permease
MPPQPSERGAALAGAMPWVFVLIWSTGFVVARLAMPHSPPLTFLAWRYAFSLLALGLWVAVARAPWPRGAAQWRHLAVSGVLMHGGYLGGVWAAVRQGIPAGTVALIVGLQPLLTAIWISGRGQHHVAALQWLGLALGLGGLTLVVAQRMGGGGVTWVNLALSLLALGSITVGTLYQKRYVVGSDVRSANLVQIAAALLVTLPLAAFEVDALHWHAELIVALLWSVLVLTLGGSSLLMILIHRGAAMRVTSLLYLVPPCTSLLAWWLFDEAVSPAAWVGMALCAAGVLMVLNGERQTTRLEG